MDEFIRFGFISCGIGILLLGCGIAVVVGKLNEIINLLERIQ